MEGAWPDVGRSQGSHPDPALVFVQNRPEVAMGTRQWVPYLSAAVLSP